jgi:hypothetical protein
MFGPNPGRPVTAALPGGFPFVNTPPAILAGMRRRDLSIRVAGLVLTGELGVHQLRYLIFPERAAGHGYLPALAVLSVVALACGAGQLVAALEGARATGRDDRVVLSFRSAWLILAASISGLFAVQETLESLLAGGGGAAFAAAFTGGGWVALPLALGLSALMAMALTGLRAAVRAAARATRAGFRRRRARRRPAWDPAPRATASPLSLNLAGRAPPLAS